MLAGWERYGLTANPYRRGPLDAAGGRDAEHSLCPVDGFRQVARLDLQIAAAVADRRPCFFLVQGRSGSGRTSVANHLLARYRWLRDLQPDRLAFIAEDRLDHHTVALLRKMVLDVYNAIDDRRWSLDGPLEQRLLDWAQATLDELVRPHFRILMRQVTRALAVLEPAAGFGILIEDVPAFEVIDAVLEVFADAETMVVFTVEDYSRAQVEVVRPYVDRERVGLQRARETVVELDSIYGSEVRDLVLHWWRMACRAAGHPFADSAIEEALGERPRTVGKVMSLMAAVLERRVLAIGAGPPWPDDRSLELTSRVLMQEIAQLGPD